MVLVKVARIKVKGVILKKINKKQAREIRYWREVICLPPNSLAEATAVGFKNSNHLFTTKNSNHCTKIPPTKQNQTTLQISSIYSICNKYSII